MAANEKRPVEVVFKIQVDGFGADLRAELYVDEIEGLVKKLRASGVQPANSPYVWTGRPQGNDAATDNDAPLCGVHGSPMKPSKKGGGYYCPRKLDDGSYCKEKAA